MTSPCANPVETLQRSWHVTCQQSLARQAALPVEHFLSYFQGPDSAYPHPVSALSPATPHYAILMNQVLRGLGRLPYSPLALCIDCNMQKFQGTGENRKQGHLHAKKTLMFRTKEILPALQIEPIVTNGIPISSRETPQTKHSEGWTVIHTRA